jgi:hypothetical protein
VLIVDEYLAIRVLAGDWPAALPDDAVGLTVSRHWRLLQRLHAPAGGQLSTLLGALSSDDRAVLRFPHPEVLTILDPRPLLDDAARLAAAFGNTGLLIAETAVAGLEHGGRLFFGTAANVGQRLTEIAAELEIEIRVVS